MVVGFGKSWVWKIEYWSGQWVWILEFSGSMFEKVVEILQFYGWVISYYVQFDGDYVVVFG